MRGMGVSAYLNFACTHRGRSVAGGRYLTIARRNDGEGPTELDGW